MSALATCPRCPASTPLISTMVFRGAEFYCLDCGKRFGFLSPRPETATPELVEKLNHYVKEWQEHVGTKLVIEGRVAKNDDAQSEHNNAIAWLSQRAARRLG